MPPEVTTWNGKHKNAMNKRELSGTANTEVIWAPRSDHLKMIRASRN